MFSCPLNGFSFVILFGYSTITSRGVSVYAPAIAGTHCAYPQRDGQAELTQLLTFKRKLNAYLFQHGVAGENRSQQNCVTVSVIVMQNIYGLAHQKVYHVCFTQIGKSGSFGNNNLDRCSKGRSCNV